MRSEKAVREQIRQLEDAVDETEDIDRIWELYWAMNWLLWVLENIDLPHDFSDEKDTGSDEWTCPNCGESEHDAILVMDDEIEVDVTCQNVYFTFNDDSHLLGMAFDHDTFEEIIEHYGNS